MGITRVQLQAIFMVRQAVVYLGQELLDAIDEEREPDPGAWVAADFVAKVANVLDPERLEGDKDPLRAFLGFWWAEADRLIGLTGRPRGRPRLFH